jgi:hypothetical protein
MKPVIQQDSTGCGIAAVAAIAGVSYGHAKRVAASLGIVASDDGLWSETGLVRRLLARYGRRVSSSPQPFHSWEGLPDCALLAIKWHREEGRAFWHWVVFVRKQGRACVWDSKPGLKTPVRRDFGRMKPKWFLYIP